MSPSITENTHRPRPQLGPARERGQNVNPKSRFPDFLVKYALLKKISSYQKYFA